MAQGVARGAAAGGGGALLLDGGARHARHAPRRGAPPNRVLVSTIIVLVSTINTISQHCNTVRHHYSTFSQHYNSTVRARAWMEARGMRDMLHAGVPTPTYKAVNI